MALNLETLRTRALTAVVFVAVMLAGLLINQWTFLLLFSIVHFGCWYEYQKLVNLIDPGYRQITPIHKYSVMLAGWSFMLWMCSEHYMLGGLPLHEIGIWLLLIGAIALPVSEILFSRKPELKNIGHSFFGLLYISLSLGLLLNLYHYQAGGVDLTRWMPILILACMWINDTMAYIVGSLIGKTPFSKISPKKTWEGTAGGAILCVIVVGLLMQYVLLPQTARNTIPAYHWYIIAAIAAVTGTAGDLLESKLKRMAGVKDSGSIMPGHGGFLDRFDSLIVATPFVWLYLKLFVH